MADPAPEATVAPVIPAETERPEDIKPFRSKLVDSMTAILFGKEANSEEAQKLHKLRMEKGGEIVFKEGSLQALGGNPDFGPMVELVQRARENNVIDDVRVALIRDDILSLLRMTRGGATLNSDEDKNLIDFLGLSNDLGESKVEVIKQDDEAELTHFAQIFGRSEQLVYLLANQLGQSGNEAELARKLQTGDLGGEKVQETLVKMINNPQFQGVLSRVLGKIAVPPHLMPILGTPNASQYLMAKNEDGSYRYERYFTVNDETGEIKSKNLVLIGQQEFQQYFQKIDEALGEAVADFYNETLLKGGKRTLELAAAQDKGKKEANVNRKDKAKELFKRFYKYALFAYKDNGETKGFNDKFMLEMVKTMKSSTPAEAMRVILRNIEATSMGRAMPRGYDDELDKALKDFGVDGTNSFDQLIDEMKDADLDAIATEAVPQVLGWAFMRPDYWKRMDFTEGQAVGLAKIYGGGEKGEDFINKVMKVRKDSKEDTQDVIKALGPNKEIDADTLMSGSEKIKQKVAKMLFGKDVRGGMKRLFIVLATLGLSDLFGVTGFLAKVVGGGAGARFAVGGAMAGGALAGANKLPGG